MTHAPHGGPAVGGRLERPVLAQLNVGRLLAPIDDPRIAGFRDRLDEINALADAHPGFVWRLVGDGNKATDLRAEFADGSVDPSLLVNLSTWRSVEALRDYTYRTPHLDLLRGRSQWFAPREGPHLVLWWSRERAPSVPEAMSRLAHLAEHGPTPHAFTFARVFEPEVAREA